jgi:hypothetical protein
MFGDIQLLDRIFDGSMDEKITASWTPLDLCKS